jgi:hypothetical protein
MKPPIDLNAEIVLPNGERIRWDAADPNVGNRPLAPAFETESGRGFSSGSVVLRRPVDRDYPELGLLNELILRSATGTIVYQGRARGIPVSEEFSLDCDGWMGYAEQREITDLIIDRDSSAWGSVSEYRRSVNTNVSSWLYDKHYTSESDRGAIVITGTTGTIPQNSTTEIAYRAPAGVRIGSFGYNGTQANTTSVNAATVIGASEDMLTDTVSANLTLDGTDRTATFTNRPRTLILGARASAAHTPTTTNAVFNRKITPTVYGETSVAIVNRGDGLTGFTASDGIRYIANRWLPKLDTSGVQDSSYLIAQGVWRDPTTPADAIRQLNSFHLWKLGIWEDRRLDFAPYDLSVADWQVAAGVDGVRVEYQGDTTENVYNGVAVSFTDVTTGESRRLTPDDSSDLRDTSDWIAANQWGDEAWLNIDVSWPCSDDDAVEIGRVALANANQARRPSTITVPAYVRDMNGTYWPSSYVRADQTILVTNQHTPIPRLITRTSWSDHSLTITTDDAIDTMEALNQRISGALSARGLV